MCAEKLTICFYFSTEFIFGMCMLDRTQPNVSNPIPKVKERYWIILIS